MQGLRGVASAVMGRTEGIADVGWVPYLLLKKRPLPVAAAPLKTGMQPGEEWTRALSEASGKYTTTSE
jgi:hypothetical protein